MRLFSGFIVVLSSRLILFKVLFFSDLTSQTLWRVLNETDAGQDDSVDYFQTNGGFCVCFCLLCVGGEEDNVLWIAMAGTHQIWALFLADGKLPKGG